MPNSDYLSSFCARHFKGLQDVRLDGLGALNLLLGANNVGKTSVIEAIFLLTGFPNLNLPIQIQNHRNFLVQSFEDLTHFFYHHELDLNVELECTLVNPSERRTLAISAPYVSELADHTVQRVKSGGNGSEARDGVEERTNLQLSTFSKSGPRLLRYDASVVNDSSQNPILFNGELTVHSMERISFPAVDEKTTQLIIPARILFPGAEYNTEAVANVIVHKRDIDLVEILREIDPQIRAIATAGNMVFVDIGIERMLPLNMFGSGIIRATSILSHCIAEHTRILLIDEIEEGLHYKGMLPLLKALLKLSRSKNIQIFCTTHSIEILRGLQGILAEDAFSEFRETTACFVLAKDKTNSVCSYRYDYTQFDHCISHGIEIR